MDDAMTGLTIRNERGAAIIVALAFLGVLMLMTTAFVSNLLASSNFEASFEAKTRSFYIAEAGLNHAMWKLGELGVDYTGESGVAFGDGSFDVEIALDPQDLDRRIIIARARLDGYPEGRTETEVRAVFDLGHLAGGNFKIAPRSWEAAR